MLLNEKRGNEWRIEDLLCYLWYLGRLVLGFSTDSYFMENDNVFVCSQKTPYPVQCNMFRTFSILNTVHAMHPIVMLYCLINKDKEGSPVCSKVFSA